VVDDFLVLFIFAAQIFPSGKPNQNGVGLAVQSGALIVLGGLDETRGRVASSALPFLPRWLWSRSGSESKTEVLLVLDVQRI
jgi:hypothetical protein